MRVVIPGRKKNVSLWYLGRGYVKENIERPV